MTTHQSECVGGGVLARTCNRSLIICEYMLVE